MDCESKERLLKMIIMAQNSEVPMDVLADFVSEYGMPDHEESLRAHNLTCRTPEHVLNCFALWQLRDFVESK